MSAQPIDFSQYVAKAPPAIDFSQYEEKNPESASSRFGTNLLSGLGVTSNEAAKNFFVHPLDTVIKSLEAQGELAKKAREAYDKGDYMGALQHGLNYLLPFIGQQTDQAGEQLKSGDIAGGVGRTIGAAIPIAAGSPEVQAAGGDVLNAAAAKTAQGVRAAARGANTVLEKAPGTIGATVGSAVGHATGIPGAAPVLGAAGFAAGKEILPQIRIPGEGFGLPSRVAGGPAVIPQFEPTAVENPFMAGPPAVPAPAAPGSAGSIAEAIAPTKTLADLSGGGAAIPRTLSGESALREVLVSEPNKTLLQIARSRGINVTAEAQLKPTNAVSNRIINKIIDDFSPDELEEVRSQHLEASRMPNEFRGDIGKEANQTINLQTFFPELKIPIARVLRTQKAIQAAKAPKFGTLSDLAGQIKSSAAASAPVKPAASASAPTDLEGQLQTMLKAARKGKKLSDLTGTQ